jgi:hypothetical protein
MITKKDFDKANADRKLKYDKAYLILIEKIKLEDMVKPTEPIAPNYKDFPNEHNVMPTPKNPNKYILALDKYGKELEEYKIKLDIWEQLRLIKDIQRSNLKLCLKKYKITKNK